MSGSVTYDLESVDALPAHLHKLVPPLSERQAIGVGSIARLCVIVNGSKMIAPWVEIVEVRADGVYVGEVGGIINSPDWLPYGSRVTFTADNVVSV